MADPLNAAYVSPATKFFLSLGRANLLCFSGVKTKRPPFLVSMAHNKPTVLRLAQHREGIRARHPLISRNMVVCLNNKDLNQPDLWLTSSLQASSLANKALMVVLQPSHQPNTRTLKWAMGALPVLVGTAVVLSRRPMLSGVLLRPKTSGTDLVATKDNRHMMPSLGQVAIPITACLLRDF